MKHNRLALSIILALAAQASQANPQGAQVVQGTASFSSPATNVLNVTNSRGAIINWQQFNIGKGQTTNFIQPSSSSSVLNRVIGNDPSQLLGKLNSNGRVFLINQNGILVGEGASINTNGFFGSTLNITDEGFLNGRLNFNGGGQGDLENQGYIHAGNDGNVVLIAPNIENGGVIDVENGNIILAAGESITITSLQNSALQFEVQSPENSVTNLGQVIAKNGAAGLFAGTLKHSGSIRAGGLVRDADGTIRLVAADAAQVSGSVQAAGGKIEILGDRVEIQQEATIDTSSEQGGGEILIGGDQQGLNPDVKNATSTTIASGAQVHADGVDNANGGKVIVFAQNDVHVQGDITARGGEYGGDGGFIETSGKQVLDITSVPDASAPIGKGGEWLIDPNDIDIVSGAGNAGINAATPFLSTQDSAQLGADLITASLNAGTSVIISTGAGGTQQLGDINIFTSIRKVSGGDASLTLNAHNNINVEASSTSAIIIDSVSGALDITFNADSDNNGTGSISFDTGFGQTSFPITINANTGTFKTNQDVFVFGDVSNPVSFVSITNSQWEIPRDTKLTLNEDLTLDLPGSTVNSYGHIDINDFSATLDLTGDSLDIPVGGSLVGSGTVIGAVTVNGGSISGGTGYDSFGVLNINGDLTINSGLLYSVSGGFSTSWESNSISASNIALNGGDLMVVWADAFAAQQASNDSFFSQFPLSLASCGGTSCITGAGLNNVINPLLISNSTVAIGGNGDTLTYSINYATDIVQNASIITWIGSKFGFWNVASNWSGGVPTASDYVFLENPDGLNQITVDGSQAAAGLQSFAGLQVIGTLALGGDSYFSSDSNPGSGSLLLTNSASLVSGAGTIYSGPGSSVLLGQGLLAKDLTSWGTSGLFDATNSFQLDSIFTNNGLFIVDDTTNVNTLTGTGSLVNNRLLQVSANFSNGVTFTNTATASLVSDTPGFNVLLDGNSMLDGTLSAVAGSTIFLSGGTHVFSPGLVQGGELNFAGGTYQGTFSQAAANTLDISATDSNVLFDGFTLNSAGAVTVSNAANSFTLNSSSWSNGAGLSLTAGSKLEVQTGSSLLLQTGTDLTGSTGGAISLSGGDLTINQMLDFATPGISLEVLNGATALLNADVNAGLFQLDGGRIGILSGTFQIGSAADLILDQAGESLFGFGTFNGNVINQSGLVTPGRFVSENTGVPGELTINGDYTQLAGGSLVIKMDSTVTGVQNDVLNVAGLLTADGAIDFKLVNGATVFQLAALIDQNFRPLRFNNFAGKFASSSIPAGLNFSLGAGGLITISSDNNLLNEVSNQLEVLFNKDDLNFDKVVRAMKFIDQKAMLIAQTEDDEDDDKKKRAPRLVCK